MIKVGIAGVTGYAGHELLRLLSKHKQVIVVKILSEKSKGKEYSQIYRNFFGHTNLICEDINYNIICDDIDVLFTALPYGVLMEHLTESILDKVRIIDIGVDYRLLNAEEYERIYSKEHKSINLSTNFTYGLCEWNREIIKQSRHIANPGCYATAAELALLPLIKENIISDKIIIDAKGSLSGAGKSLSVGTHYTEANESTKAYKITNHPHKTEIKKSFQYFTNNNNINLSFVPHIVPMQRGILVSCYTEMNDLFDYNAIKSIYNKYYSNERFVQVLDKGMYVETKWVKNSNMCHINYEICDNNLYVFAAIDNLIKGAAGQAIQNMNIMYGLQENEGLDMIPTCL